MGAAPVSPAVVTSAKPADDAGGTATSGKIEASCPAALPGFTLSQSSRGPSEYGVEDLDELFCLYDDTADGQILGYSVALYATESQAEAMNDPHADARKVYDLDTATPLEMGDGGWDTGDAAGCFVRYGREIVVAEIVTEKPDHAIHEHMLRWCAADPR